MLLFQYIVFWFPFSVHFLKRWLLLTISLVQLHLQCLHSTWVWLKLALSSVCLPASRLYVCYCACSFFSLNFQLPPCNAAQLSVHSSIRIRNLWLCSAKIVIYPDVHLSCQSIMNANENIWISLLPSISSRTIIFAEVIHLIKYELPNHSCYEINLYQLAYISQSSCYTHYFSKLNIPWLLVFLYNQINIYCNMAIWTFLIQSTSKLFWKILYIYF